MANPEFKFFQQENRAKWWRLAALGVVGVIAVGAIISYVDHLMASKIKL